MTSTDEELGKPTGSDREKEKNTFVSLLGLDRSRELVAELTAGRLRSGWVCQPGLPGVAGQHPGSAYEIRLTVSQRERKGAVWIIQAS